MKDKEFILFCDESEEFGRYYSNFYGGVMVGSSQYGRIIDLLERAKHELHFHGEVKWRKVSDSYLEKYKLLISVFFQEVAKGHLRICIMFRQNAREPHGLTRDQIEGSYFRLYYQFIKHAFGLEHATVSKSAVNLRLYFDEFPETGEGIVMRAGLGPLPFTERSSFV